MADEVYQGGLSDLIAPPAPPPAPDTDSPQAHIAASFLHHGSDPQAIMGHPGMQRPSDTTFKEYAKDVGDMYSDRLKELGLDDNGHREKLESKLRHHARVHSLMNMKDRIVQGGKMSFLGMEGNRNTGGFGSLEGAFNKFPFVGMVTGTQKAEARTKAQEAIQKEKGSEWDYFHAAQQMAEEEEAAKQGLVGKTADVVAGLPGGAAEFMLSGGIGGTGAFAAKAGMTGILARMGARAAGTIANQAPLAGARIMAGTAQRMAPSFGTDEEGNLQYKKGEDFHKAAAKSLAADLIQQGAFGALGFQSSFGGEKASPKLLERFLSLAGTTELSEDAKMAIGDRGGPIAQLATAKTDEEREAALKNVIAHGAGFLLYEAAQHAAHSAKQNGLTQPRAKDFNKAFENIAKLSPEERIAALTKHGIRPDLARAAVETDAGIRRPQAPEQIELPGQQQAPSEPRGPEDASFTMKPGAEEGEAPPSKIQSFQKEIEAPEKQPDMGERESTMDRRLRQAKEAEIERRSNIDWAKMREKLRAEKGIGPVPEPTREQFVEGFKKRGFTESRANELADAQFGREMKQASPEDAMKAAEARRQAEMAPQEFDPNAYAEQLAAQGVPSDQIGKMVAQKMREGNTPPPRQDRVETPPPAKAVKPPSTPAEASPAPSGEAPEPISPRAQSRLKKMHASIDAMEKDLQAGKDIEAPQEKAGQTIEVGRKEKYHDPDTMQPEDLQEVAEVQGLKPGQVDLLRDRLGGEDLADIGEREGTSREAPRQREKRALGKMPHAVESIDKDVFKPLNAGEETGAERGVGPEDLGFTEKQGVKKGKKQKKDPLNDAVDDWINNQSEENIAKIRALLPEHQKALLDAQKEYADERRQRDKRSGERHEPASVRREISETIQRGKEAGNSHTDSRVARSAEGNSKVSPAAAPGGASRGNKLSPENLAAAKDAGLDPEHVTGLAAMHRETAEKSAADRNDILKSARKSLGNAAKWIPTERVKDATQLEGFDEVAGDLKERLAPYAEAGEDPSDTLFRLLKEGNHKPLTWKQAHEKAIHDLSLAKLQREHAEANQRDSQAEIQAGHSAESVAEAVHEGQAAGDQTEEDEGGRSEAQADVSGKHDIGSGFHFGANAAQSEPGHGSAEPGGHPGTGIGGRRGRDSLRGRIRDYMDRPFNKEESQALLKEAADTFTDQQLDDLRAEMDKERAGNLWNGRGRQRTRERNLRFLEGELERGSKKRYDQQYEDWRRDYNEFRKKAYEQANFVKDGMTPDRAREVLGVGEDATAEEIKAAFRRKAMETHPDRNPGENTARAFGEAKAAFDVLFERAAPGMSAKKAADDAATSADSEVKSGGPKQIGVGGRGQPGVEPAAKVAHDFLNETDQPEPPAPAPKQTSGLAERDPFRKAAMDFLREEEGFGYPFGIPPVALTMAKKAVQAIHDDVRSLAGKMFPKTSREAETSGNAMARHSNVNAYSQMAAPVYGEKVMGRGATFADRLLYGEAVSEYRLQYMRNALRNLLGQVQTLAGPNPSPAHSRKIAQLQQAIADVKTLVGHADSAIGSQAEYRQIIQTPKFKEILDNWQRHMVPAMDDMYRRAQGMDPTDPINSITQIPGLPINLYPMEEGQTPGPGKVRVGGGPGNLKNVRHGSLVFAAQATGAAEGYNTDLFAMIENSFKRGAQAASKAEMFRTLVGDGLGVWGEPNRKIPGMKEIPNVNPPLGTQDAKKGETSFYVKEAAHTELDRALDLDKKMVIPYLTAALSAGTKGALLSTVEAAYHGANLLTIGSLPGVNPIKLVANGYKTLFRNPEAMSRLVDLARIGAAKEHGLQSPQFSEEGSNLNPLTLAGKATHASGRFIDWMDKTSRLTANDAFDTLVKQGRVKDTEANRRDFINQALGQYNRKAQPFIVRLARDSGIGPFATAGTNFWTKGLRSLLMDPGVQATNYTHALGLRAEMAARFAAGIGAVALINYLAWKDPWPEDVGFGAVKLGTKDGRTSSLNLMTYLGLGSLARGMRSSGLMSVVEGTRKGESRGEIIDKAKDRIIGGLTHPVKGPGVQFIHTAISGKDSFGRHISEKAEKGESQSANNLQAALKHWNPIYAQLTGADKPNKEVPWDERVMSLLGPFGVQYREAHGGTTTHRATTHNTSHNTFRARTRPQ